MDSGQNVLSKSIIFIKKYDDYVPDIFILLCIGQTLSVE